MRAPEYVIDQNWYTEKMVYWRLLKRTVSDGEDVYLPPLPICSHLESREHAMACMVADIEGVLTHKMVRKIMPLPQIIHAEVGRFDAQGEPI